MTITYLAAIPSPAQGVWHLGPLPIRAYALCIIAGIVVGVWIGNRRFVARGGRPGRVTDVAVFCVPFGLVGGRLYHVITDNELYFRPGRNPWNAFAIWDGGLGIWGAIALGGVGAWWGCRYYKIPLPAFADALAPGIAVAQAIGRLGNYFNQELYGSPTSVPWALQVFLRTPGGVSGTKALCGTNPEFPTDWIKAGPSVTCGFYQPTFLYELLWDLGVAALVIWADRRFRLGGGRAFWLYVAGYTAGRTWIEMLRVDTANHFLGLRINVFTSVILFVVACVFLYVLRNRAREDPALLRGKPPKGQPEDQVVTEATDGTAEPAHPEVVADPGNRDDPGSSPAPDSDAETEIQADTAHR